MRLGPDAADEAFRQELLAFLDEHAPSEARRGRDWIGDDDDVDAQGVMASPTGRGAGRRRCSTTAG